MSYSLPPDSRQCGRCAWWDSMRYVDRERKLAIESREGCCRNDKASAGMAHANTEYTWSCPAFELWDKLR